MSIYKAVIISVWVAAAICVPILHYIAIPHISWITCIKICVWLGAAASPVFLLCALIANSVTSINPKDS